MHYERVCQREGKSVGWEDLVQGKKPRLTERETPPQAEVVDLMERLRASLEGKKSSGARKTAGRKPAATKKTAPRKKAGRAA